MNNKQESTIREAVKKEYIKCSLDPVYFMRNYIKVKHQAKGIILFDLYPFQEKILKDFHDYDRNIILKSRQMGISTLVSAYALWIMLFKPGKDILVISIKQEASKEIISKVQLAYNNLPVWLKVEAIEENILSLKLKNESRIIAASSAESAARGISAFLVIMDECLGFDSYIYIRNKKTKIIEKIKIGDLYESRKYNCEVLTPGGWSNFDGINKVEKKCFVKIIFEDDEKIECSENHKLKLFNGKFCYAKNLKKGHKILSINGIKIIKSKRKINKKTNLYDLINVEKNQEFYSNDVISHNCAFIEGAQDVWTATQQTMATGGSAILLSTPRGVGGFFHKMWVDAEAKRNGFHTIKIPWNLHPERDITWRYKQTIELGDAMASQECVDGDTRIYTKRGLKPIKEIDENDFVLTHTGNYRKVIKKINNGIQNTIGISTSLNRKISYITKNHPILTKNYEWKKIGEFKNKDLAIEFPNVDNNKYCSVYISDIVNECEVYNLEVEIDHSYITEHFVVHNCDAEFLTSGTSVIDLRTLKWYEENIQKEPIELRGDQSLWIFEKPDPNKDYIITSDVARGDGNDYSAAHVLELDTMEQVAEYQNKIDTKEYGNLLVALATEYNDALLVVENANIGWAVLQQIIDRQYKNTFYSSPDLKIVEIQRQLINRYYREDQKLRPGFTTTTNTRPLIVAKLVEYFRDKSIIIRSCRTINELKTFIWDKGKAQAAEGYNDDLCISLGIGLWVRDTALRLRSEGILLTKTMLDKISVTQPSDRIPIYTAKQQGVGKDYWRMRTGTGKPDSYEDLRWLLK